MKHQTPPPDRGPASPPLNPRVTPALVPDVSTATGQAQQDRNLAMEPVPTLTLISHPQLARAGERLFLHALTRGKEVLLSRNAPDFAAPGSVMGMPLDDPFISRKPLRLLPGTQGGVLLSVEESRPVKVDGRQVTDRVEISAAMLASGVVLELAERVVLLLHMGVSAPGIQPPDLGMVGSSAGILRVRQQLIHLSDLTVPVLIRGETGTGKELVAQALHANSPRREKPFVAVNLGAISTELAPVELFGASKGAFTGATRDRDGFFAAADGGTLFLDEVGEAAPALQALLLRVLETGEMFPVGSQTRVKTNVRLITATDADLNQQIRDGRFKAPLLHRLAGYEIHLPALRERREDIGMLFHHFARQELMALGEAHWLSPSDAYGAPWLPASVATALLNCAWPGNIRQLRNLTRRLVIGSRGLPQLHIDPYLMAELESETARPASFDKAPSPPIPPETPVQSAGRRKPSEVTEEELREALRASLWELKVAADRLGIPRSSIYDLIGRTKGIRTAGDVSETELRTCFEACQGDLQRMVERLEVSGQALKRRLGELGLGRT